MCGSEVNVPLFNMCLKYLFFSLSPFIARIIIAVIYCGANILITSDFFLMNHCNDLCCHIHASFVLVGHMIIIFSPLSLKHRTNALK